MKSSITQSPSCCSVVYLVICFVGIAACSDNTEEQPLTVTKPIHTNAVVVLPVSGEVFQVVPAGKEEKTLSIDETTTVKTQLYDKAVHTLSEHGYVFVDVDFEAEQAGSPNLQGNILKIRSAYNAISTGIPFTPESQEKDFIKRYGLNGELQAIGQRFGAASLLLVQFSGLQQADNAGQMIADRDIAAWEQERDYVPGADAYYIEAMLVDIGSREVLWKARENGSDVQNVVATLFTNFPDFVGVKTPGS